MRRFHLLQAKLFLMVAVCVFSCDDHRIPAVAPGSTTDKLRVKSITQQITETGGRIGAVQMVSVFSYDAQGRLSGIVTTQVPNDPTAPIDNSVFSYDDQNRLTQLKRVITQTGIDPAPEETYTYTYNHAGQVSQLNYSNNSVDDINKWKVTYLYTPGNQLASSLRSFAWSPVAYSENLDYTYTGKNITKTVATVTETRLPASTLTGTRTNTYTYDTNRNPFYGIFVIPAPFTTGLSNPLAGTFRYYTYYGGFDNLFNLSENNVTSEVFLSTTTTYAYTYNAAHLPLTRVKTSDGKTETLQYEYESY